MEGLGVIVHVVNFLGSYILLFLFAYPVSWKTFLSPICQQYFIDLSLTSLISSSELKITSNVLVCVYLFSEMAKHVHGRKVVPEFNIGHRIYADTFT